MFYLTGGECLSWFENEFKHAFQAYESVEWRSPILPNENVLTQKMLYDHTCAALQCSTHLSN